MASDEPEREFADFKNADGDLIIYMTANAEAWVQSDRYVQLGETTPDA